MEEGFAMIDVRERGWGEVMMERKRERLKVMAAGGFSRVVFFLKMLYFLRKNCEGYLWLRFELRIYGGDLNIG